MKFKIDEVERLKYECEFFEPGIKVKINQTALIPVTNLAQKLKTEAELRETSEKKADELSAEINLLKTKEINRAKEDVEIERNMLAGKFSLSFTVFVFPHHMNNNNNVFNNGLISVAIHREATDGTKCNAYPFEARQCRKSSTS